MLSNLKNLSIVKKLSIVFTINIVVFLIIIWFGYTFTKNNTKQLEDIGNKYLLISSFHSSNLKLLENIAINFSDAALTNELDILLNADEQKKIILSNFDRLEELDQNNKNNREKFLKYYDFAYNFTTALIKNNNHFDAKGMVKLKDLTKEALKLFKSNADKSLEHLTSSINKVSTNTNDFFYNSSYIVFIGIAILICNGIFVYLLITRRFKDIFNSIEDLVLSKPDFSSRLEYSSNDEIDEIKRLVNKLKDKQEEDYKDLEKLKLESEVFLEKEIEDTQKEVVFKMGAIGETRSKETGNHVRRVAEYSKIFALEYGLSEMEAEILKQASPMHDIGKVGIPDNILNKAGKLNTDEYKIMQTHAELGYEMLKGSNRPLLKIASIVAYEHHEKWDGSGYPRGLSGDEISIYGRITAIADVFDALGSDRCYKKAWNDEEIFQLFRDERAKHFDPKLVDIFFDKLPLFLEIRSEFKDI